MTLLVHASYSLLRESCKTDFLCTLSGLVFRDGGDNFLSQSPVNMVVFQKIITTASTCGYSFSSFFYDVTAAILMFQNNKTVAMLVFKTIPVGVEKRSFVSIDLHSCSPRECKRSIFLTSYYDKS